MVIGVLKEIKGNEYRVAAVPATVHEIVRHGHTVYAVSYTHLLLYFYTIAVRRVCPCSSVVLRKQHKQQHEKEKQPENLRR